MRLLPLISPVILLASALGGSQLRSHAHDLREAQPPVHPSGFENLYVPSTTTLRAATAGYNQAAADIMWIRILGYFGKHMASDRQFMWLITFVDQLLDLDPLFRAVYQTSATIVKYGSTIDDESVMNSIRILERGMAQFPDDYDIVYDIGFNYRFEMKGKTPEEREAYQKKGMEYLELAANMPGAPWEYADLVGSLYQRGGETELARRYLTDVYLRTEEVALRKVIKKQLDTLGAGEALEALREEADAVEARRAESFPYVPLEFYLLLDGRSAVDPGDQDWRRLTGERRAPSAQEP